MSFTIPNIFKPSQQPEVVIPQPPTVEVPKFDHPEELQVLPYDWAANEIERSVSRYGRTVLKDHFGISDVEEATAKLVDLRSKTSSAADAIRRGDNSEEALWDKYALKGDEAQIALYSLEKQAKSPERNYYTSQAAHALSEIHPDDTRIVIK